MNPRTKIGIALLVNYTLPAAAILCVLSVPILYKVGDMIQGIVMAEMALVAAVVAVVEDEDGDGEGTVILGVMGTMSLDLQGGALAQGTTMVKDLRAGEAVEVGMDGAVVEMITVGEIVAAVHGAAALGVVAEMVVGAHGEMGEVVVIGAGQSSLRNWYPLSQMPVVAGVEVVVGDGNKNEMPIVDAPCFVLFPPHHLFSSKV